MAVSTFYSNLIWVCCTAVNLRQRLELHSYKVYTDKCRAYGQDWVTTTVTLTLTCDLLDWWTFNPKDRKNWKDKGLFCAKLGAHARFTVDLQCGQAERHINDTDSYNTWTGKHWQYKQLYGEQSQPDNNIRQTGYPRHNISTPINVYKKKHSKWAYFCT